MSDNSWYEKRLNPPAGTVCEAMFDGVWHKVEILKYAGEMNAAACLLSYSINGRNLYWSSQFRPIKTEREIAIDAAWNAIDHLGYTNTAIKEIAGALFDIGLLRSKNES